ncbi:MAG: TolC family protein [Xanthomonadaceae bacterium]|nr:TolC family protein [Xanthomonadaceae bacterium]
MLTSLILVATVSSSLAALPKDAQKFLNSFPEKKVTIDLVVGRAMAVSDSFKSVVAGSISTESSQLESQAALDPYLTLVGSRGVNRNEPQTPFSPNLVVNTDAALTVGKKFSSGTNLGLNIKHSKNELGFSAFPGLDFYETRVGISLSQDFWKNAFGNSARAQLKLGEALSKASEYSIKESIENWETALQTVFYQTWYAQNLARITEETVTRRKRLSETTRIKLTRGTAERPDLLQVESAELQAKTQRESAAELLWNSWRGLVLQLKLPSDWIKIDPMEIPIAIDDRIEESTKICYDVTKKLNALPESATLTRAKLQKESAEYALDVAKDSLRPSLALTGDLFGNDIDYTSASPTFGNAFTLINPGWSVAIQFALPLANSGAEGAVRRSVTDWIRAEAAASDAESQQKLGWLNACAELSRSERAHARYVESFEKQTKRASLEEQRFKIGRTSTQFVIQAQDEAAGAEQQLMQSEMERRLAGWKIIKLKDGFQSYNESLKEKYGKVQL